MAQLKQKVLVRPTDNTAGVQNSIDERVGTYPKDLPAMWRTATPSYSTTPHGEHILKIHDYEVMSNFESPYMDALGEYVAQQGGHVLNVGFGLGLVDGYIQQHTKELASHHIIELNETVLHNGHTWSKGQPQSNKIHFHVGNWKTVLPAMKAAGIVFDAVVYDAYPLEEKDICRDVVDFLQELIDLQLVREHTGIITFYLDSVNGLGNGFQAFLLNLGVTEFSFKKVPITLPTDGTRYWERDYFLAPLLSGVEYSQPSAATPA